jgi:Tol biopolymer transport system component
LHTVDISASAATLNDTVARDSSAGCAWLTWLPDNRTVICSASAAGSFNRFLRRIDTERTRPPEPLPFGEEGLSLAAAGSRLVYMRRSIDTDLWRAANPETGGRSEPAKFVFSTKLDVNPVFSPDGQHLAFLSDRTGTYEIWIAKADGTGAVRLTSFSKPGITTPRWSPDGRWIVFAFGGQLYRIESNGGVPQRISDDIGSSHPSYSPDGEWLYYSSTRSGRAEVWRMPSRGGAATQITAAGGTHPLISGDGSTLFYLKSGSDSSYLFQAPSGGGPEVQISAVVFGRHSVHAADKGAYYVESGDWDGTPGILYHDAVTGQKRKVATMPGRRRWTASGLSLSPDRRWFVFAMYEFDSDLMLVENFR